jgi:hydrogenase-4 component F
MNPGDWHYLYPMAAALAGTLLCAVPVLFFEEIASVLAAGTCVVFSILVLFLPDVHTGWIMVDGLSKIMLAVVAVVYLGTVLYSITYLRYIESPLFQKRFYYLLLNVFSFSMLFTVSVGSLGLVWVGIEATTVTSALLVATENEQTSMEAAWRYVIIVSCGLVISLIAVELISFASKTLDVATLIGLGETGRIFTVGALLAILGFGTKAGLFPLSTWLPDVHGRAPSPVSAIFSSVLLPVAMFGIIRITEMAASPLVRSFEFVFGLMTVVSAALLLTRQSDYKRMYAYSTIENMGMILIGISAGGLGALGAVVVLVSHAFAKASVFLLTGNLLARYRSTRIADVSGIARRMPQTGYALFFASLAVTGAPPFAVFAGELLIVTAIWQHFGAVAACAVLAGLVVAFISINRRVVSMIFSGGDGERMERGRIGTLVPIANVCLSFAVIAVVPFLSSVLKGVLGI